MLSDISSRRGLFVTVEGGEAVGKSTLIKQLPLLLKVMGEKTLVTREPGGTKGAEALRSLLLSPPDKVEWSPVSQVLMFYAARANHLENVIRPALASGQIVICDRFSDSTRAYQIVAGGLEMNTLDQIDSIVVNETQPDLTFILDLSVEEARKRLVDRGEAADAFEGLDEKFHQDVRAAFLKIAEDYPERCVVIDASQAAEDVLADCIRVLEDRLS